MNREEGGRRREEGKEYGMAAKEKERKGKRSEDEQCGCGSDDRHLVPGNIGR